MAALALETRDRLNVVLRLISQRVQPVATYLFGSRAEGAPDRWSDYDLAIFIEEFEQFDVPGLARFCASIQKEAGDDIELHFFPADRLLDPEQGSFSAHIIEHGIHVPFDGSDSG